MKMIPRAYIVVVVLISTAVVVADELPIYDIPKLSGITIDGQADDWGDKGFAINRLADGSGAVNRQDNFAARFRLGWNDQGLLVLAVVRDETVAEAVPFETWGDFVQVVLSTAPGADDLIRAIVIPGRDERGSGLRSGFVDPGKSGADVVRNVGGQLAALKIQAAGTNTKTGYIVEALIPWSNLGIKPAEGLELALNVVVADADRVGFFVRTFGASWYPLHDVTGRVDRAALHRIRLARSASPPQDLVVRVTCPGAIMTVNVAAAKELAGKEIVLKRGQTVVSRAKLGEGHGCSTASLVAPVSAFEGTAVATVEVASGPKAVAILGGPDAPGLLANYILSCDGCQAWDMEYVRNVFGTLSAASRQGADAQLRLIEGFDKTYIHNAARLRHGEINGLSVVNEFLPELSDQQAERWAAEIGDVLEMKQPVDAENVPFLLQAQAALTKTDTFRCVTDWLAQHGPSATDDCLIELGLRFNRLRESEHGLIIRTAVARRLDEILKRRDLTAVEIYRINVLVTYLHGTLSSQQKEAFARKLTSVFMADGEKRIASLNAWAFGLLVDACHLLDDSAGVAGLLDSQTCKIFPASQQAVIVAVAGKNVEGLAGLRRQVEAQFPALLADKAFDDAWRIVGDLSPLSSEVKAQWALAFREMFLADAKAVAALSDEEFLSAAQCLARLEDAEGMSRLLKDGRIVQRFTLGQLTSLAHVLTWFDKGAELTPVIQDHFEKAYLSGGRLEQENLAAVVAFAGHLADKLSADRKAVWRDLLRAKLVKNNMFTAAVGAETLVPVTGLLVSLGDKDAPAAAVAWLEANWTRVSLETVTELVASPQLSSLSSEEKARFAAYVQRYLSDDAAMSRVGLRRASTAIETVAGFLETERKPQLAETLAKRYVLGKETSVAALSPGEMGLLLSMTANLGSVQGMKALLENNTTWHGGTFSDFTHLYGAIQKLGEEGTPLALSFIPPFEQACASGRFASDDMGAVINFCREISSRLPAEKKTSLAGSLKRAYFPDAKTAATLTVEQVRSLLDVLTVLGNVEAATALLKSNGAWHNGTPFDLNNLIDSVTRLGADGVPMELLVGEQFEKAHIVGDGLTKTADVRAVASLGLRMVGHLDAERRALWRERVRASLLGKDGTFHSDMMPEDFPTVATFLAHLGSSEGIAGLAGQWLDDNANNVSFSTVVGLFTLSHETRTELVGHVERFLLDDSRMADVSVVDASRAVAQVAEHLKAAGQFTADRKNTLVASLTKRYMTDRAAMTSLTSRDVEVLFRALATLDASAAAATLLSVNTAWHAGSLPDFASLCAAVRLIGDDRAELAQSISERFEKHYLFKPPLGEEMSTVATALDSIAWELPPQRVAALAKRLETLYGDKKFLAELTAQQASNAVFAAVRTGSAEGVRLVLAGNTNWPNLPLDQMSQLASTLMRLGDTGEPVREMMVTRAVAALDKTGAATNLSDVMRFISALSDKLSPTQKKAVAERLMRTYFPDNKSAAALTMAQIQPLLEALTVLGSVEMTTKLMKSNAPWRAGTPDELNHVIGSVTRLGEDGVPLELMIGEQFEKTYITGDGLAKSMDVRAVASLGLRMVGRLTPERKVLWRERVHAAMLGKDGKFRGDVTPEDFPVVASWLTHLGDEAGLPALAGQWLENYADSVSFVTMMGLFMLSHATRAELAGHAERFLLDDSRMTDVSVSEASRAVAQVAEQIRVAGQLTTDRRDALTASLMKRHASDRSAVLSLTPGDVEALLNALSHLDALETAAALLATNTAWHEGALSDFASLCSATRRFSVDRASLAQTVSERFEKRYMSAPPHGEELHAFAITLDSMAWELLPERTAALAKRLETLYGDKTFMAELTAQQATSAVLAAVRVGSAEGVRLVLAGNANWPSLPLDQMSQLASTIMRLGESGESVREMMVTRAVASLDGAGASMDLSDVMRFISALSDKLSPAQKKVVTDGLKRAYFPDAKAAASLTLEPVRLLLDVLTLLGNVETTTALLKSNASWRGGSPADLNNIVDSVTRLGEAGIPLELMISEQFEKTYITGGGLAKSTEVRAVASLGQRMVKHLTPERRALWRERVHAAMLGKDGKFRGDMTPEDFPAVANLLMHLGDEAGLPALAGQWLESSGGDVNFATLMGLYTLSQMTRTELAGHVERFLLDDTRMSGVPMADALRVASELAGQLAADRKSALVASLMKRHAPNRSAMTSLTLDDLNALFGALSHLDAADAAATLLKTSTAWHAGTLPEYASLCATVRRFSEGRAELTQAISEQFETRYLSKPPRGEEMATFAIALDLMDGELAPERVTSLAKRLETLYGDKTFVSSLTASQVQDALRVAVRIDSVNGARTVLTGNTNWHGLPLDQMSQLLSELARLGDSGEPVRGLVITRVTAALDGAKSTAEFANVAWFLASLSETLSPAQKKSVSQKLMSLYSRVDSRVHELSAWEFNRIREGHVRLLDAPADRASMAAALCSAFEKSCVSGRFALAGLPDVVGFCREVSPHLPEAKKASLAGSLRRTYFPQAKAAATLAVEQTRSLLDALTVLGSVETATALLEGSTSWHTGTPADMSNIIDSVSRLGADGTPLEIMIGEQFEKTYITGDGLAKSAEIRAVASLGHRLTSHLTPERRTLWRERVRLALLDKDGVFRGSMTPEDFPAVANLLMSLGDEASLSVLAGQWLETHGSDASFTTVMGLFTLSPATRAALAGHMEQFLLDDSRMADVSVVDASRAVGQMVEHLRAAEQLTSGRTNALAGSLMKRHAPDRAAMTSLTSRDVEVLFRALSQLDASEDASALLMTNTAWHAGSLSDFASLCAAVRHLGDGRAAMAQSISERFEKQYLSKPLHGEELSTIATALDYLAWELSPERMAALAKRLEALYGDKKFVTELTAQQAASAVFAAVRTGSVEGVRLVLAGNANWPQLSLDQMSQLASTLTRLGDSGEPVREMMVTRAAAALATMKTASQMSDARKLFDVVAGTLSLRQKQTIADGLLARLTLTDDDTAAEIVDLAMILMRLEAADSLKSLLTNERLAKLTLTDMERLAETLRQAMPWEKGAPVRQTLVEHVEQVWITGGKLQWADLRPMHELTKRILEGFSADRKKAWAKSLRTLMDTRANLVPMTVDSLVNLDNLLRWLGDGDSGTIFWQWLAISTQWQSVDIGRLLEHGWPAVTTDEEKTLQRTFSEYILNRHAGDDDAARVISLSGWHRAVMRLSPEWSPAQKRQVATRLFTAYADVYRCAKLHPGELANLMGMLEAMGRQGLSMQVAQVHRLAGGNSNNLRDGQCTDAVCGLVLSQMTVAPAADRRKVWESGSYYIADAFGQFSDRTFEVLDAFIEAAESDPALVEAVLDDLARRTRDVHDTLPRLKRRLAGLALARQLQDAPAAIQKAYQQARQLQTAGDQAGATAAFRAIADGKDCPANIKDVLHRRIVAMLLEQEADLEAVGNYLSALRQGGQLDPEVWNLSCRALLRRVVWAEKDRGEVWKKGLAELNAAVVIEIHEETFEDLDKVVEFLAPNHAQGSGDVALSILTDLLLAAPDHYSMRRLQWRRITLFAKAKDWDNSAAASAMDVALAAASGQGVGPSLDRHMEMLRSGGMTEARVSEAMGHLLNGSAGAAAQSAGKLIDEPLRKAAQEKVATLSQPENADDRRVAYLAALAGKSDTALARAQNRLARCTTSREAADALADIYGLLALCDADISNAHRFAVWLASSDNPISTKPDPNHDALLAQLVNGLGNTQPPAGVKESPFTNWPAEKKAALARAYCDSWATEINRSAGLARDTGNKALSYRFHGLALRSLQKPETIAASLDSMAAFLQTRMETSELMTTLKEVSAFVPTLPHRRIVLMKLANLAREEGLFDECLDFLDEADALDAKNKDFIAAMLRASALLELDEYDTADEILADAASWAGTDDNKAQCLFVTACLRLKQGQMKPAREILQTLIEQYPEAIVAARASQLAARIK